MRGDQHVRHPPERVVVRQRLGVEHVERRAGDAGADCSASTSAASSTTGPRATLTRRRRAASSASSGAPIRPRVARSAGRPSTTKSLCASSSCNGTRRARCSPAAAGTACARAPHRQALRRTGARPPGRRGRSRPARACGRPTRSPASASARARAQPALRARSAASPAALPRASCSMLRSTCSATVSALTPGRLATSTPWAVAAAIGIMSTPAPWRTAPIRLAARVEDVVGQLRAHDHHLAADGERPQRVGRGVRRDDDIALLRQPRLRLRMNGLGEQDARHAQGRVLCLAGFAVGALGGQRTPPRRARPALRRRTSGSRRPRPSGGGAESAGPTSASCASIAR